MNAGEVMPSLVDEDVDVDVDDDDDDVESFNVFNCTLEGPS